MGCPARAHSTREHVTGRKIAHESRRKVGGKLCTLAWTVNVFIDSAKVNYGIEEFIICRPDQIRSGTKVDYAVCVSGSDKCPDGVRPHRVDCGDANHSSQAS